MNSWKLGFTLLSVTVPLLGCNLTDDQKERIDNAEDNVEKIALAPQITKPSEDETISGIVDVYVDVDTDKIDQYKSVTLFIEGSPELVDDEYPYEFTFDSYFWSDNERISLLAKLETLGGNQLRSEVLSIPVDPSANDAITFVSPTANAQLQDVNQVSLKWNSLDSAVEYEYRVNGGEEQAIEGTEVMLPLPQLGAYTVEVRATDAEDHTGDWSSPMAFSLVAPDLPVVKEVSTGETPDAFSLSVEFSDTTANTQIQVSADSSFAGSEVVDVESSLYTTEKVAGVYYFRVRAVNEFGHSSDWTSPEEVHVGMFAHAINVATGWDDWDYPIDMVISDEDLVFVSGRGPGSDGSGDSFYVSKVDYSSGREWGKAFGSIIASPTSVSESESGYILTGRGPSSYRDGVIMGIDGLGQFQWKKTFPSEIGELDGNETYTQHSFADAVAIGSGKYIILDNEYKRKSTGTWSSTLVYQKDLVRVYDQVNDLNSSNEITDPIGGEFSSFTDLLVSADSVYAAGRYTKDGAAGDSSDDGFAPVQSENGAVLLEISKADGSIENTRIAGGFSDRYKGDLLQSSNGDLYVSYSDYQKAGASIFDSNGQSSSFFSTSGMEYAHLAGGIDSVVYMVGESTSNYQRPFVVKYDNGMEVERVNLDGYSFDLSVKAAMYHEKYGTIVMAVDKGQVGFDSSDSYTVFFNITDDLKFITPEELVVDYGD